MAPSDPNDRLTFGDIRRFETIDSTNVWVAEQAREGAPEGLVAVADYQTAGRGRLDRTWSATPGTALLVSVLLRPDVPPDRLPLVMMAVGLAAADGVEAAAGVRPGLKWPNDLVAADDRKLAGILAQGSAGAVVAGVGINVAEGAYPPELAEAAVSCEELAGKPVDREAVLQAFLASLADRYASLSTPGKLLEDYETACVTLGRRVRVELPGKTLEGFAVRIAEDGRLMITDREGAPHRIAAGDIIHLR